IQSVSGNLHRHLWRKIRNNQCWPALYRERCGGLGSVADQSAQELYWSLVFGFCDRDDHESCGCRTCAIHTQADAEKAYLLDDPLTVCRAVSVVRPGRTLSAPTTGRCKACSPMESSLSKSPVGQTAK